MTAEQAKLRRLLRLEKIRAIAKQTAASEAARAESTLAQMQALAARTRELAEDYGARRNAADGGGLRRLVAFATALNDMSAKTRADVDRARAIADRRQIELGAAERRRSAVNDRAEAQVREMAANTQYSALGGKKSGKIHGRGETGTALE